MTENELEAIEALAAKLRGADLGPLEAETAEGFERLLEETGWLVAEVRRLRRDPGPLGAFLRWRRVEKGLSLEQLAREASLQPGPVPVSPEEVRALEEGTQPTGPRWGDVLQAIAGALGARRDELPPA